MSAALVLVMVVVLLGFALVVVLVLAKLLRAESDKVRAARAPKVVGAGTVVEPVETTTGESEDPTADTEDTAPVDGFETPASRAAQPPSA